METKQFAHGIMFHHFHDDGIHPKGQGSITAEMFDRMIHWLRQHYRILNAMEWYEWSLQGRLSERDVCITFDDNLLCQSDIALPVLKRYDIQAFWFAYTSPLQGVREKLEVYRYFRNTCFDDVTAFYDAFTATLNESPHAEKVNEALKHFDADSYLTSWSYYTRADKVFRYTRDNLLGVANYYQVMDLMMAREGVEIEDVSKNLWNGEAELRRLHENGHVLGLHSHSHPTKMTDLSYEEQLREYSMNVEILRGITGKDIFAMSHPCNSYNDDTLNVLRQLGVQLGFRADMNCAFNSPFEYPRLDQALLMIPA